MEKWYTLRGIFPPLKEGDVVRVHPEAETRSRGMTVHIRKSRDRVTLIATGADFYQEVSTSRRPWYRREEVKPIAVEDFL